jgi:hypothetical protein
MARATFLTDLKLIVDTISRRWDCSEIYELLDLQPAEMQRRTLKNKAPSPLAIATGLTDLRGDESLTSGD